MQRRKSNRPAGEAWRRRAGRKMLKIPPFHFILKATLQSLVHADMASTRGDVEVCFCKCHEGHFFL